MNIKNNIAIEAATDGACSGNPGNGGWGGLIIFADGSEIEIGGASENTTNNRMELTAAIKTLEKLQNFRLKENFKLRSDSKYLIEGYTNWIKNWKKNGWKTSNGKVVQNLDLWQKIDSLRISGLTMEFVKGHSGDYSNERVDLIATSYSKGINIDKNSKQKTFLLDKKDIAPENIKNLFYRINLIDNFTNKKYLLKSKELCELLGIENNSNIESHKEFKWRNWIMKPIKNEFWQIIKNNDFE
tara:strand:- start:1005 stop:1730 length:726 start_codon:yes stop_codon:yes gene_type:complete